MYAALRWVEAHGGPRIAAIGQREVLDVYRRLGLTPLGREVACGAVRFERMAATPEELRETLTRRAVTFESAASSQTMVKDRWLTEHSYRELKAEPGLDHFEGRTWPGWHRHVTLAFMAYAFLQIHRFPEKRKGAEFR